MAGSIEVICGPMFSGKTEELIKRVRRASLAKQTMMMFKPKIDNRYSKNAIESHDRRNIGATELNNSTELVISVQNYMSLHEGELPQIIVVDEVQFFDDNIVQILYNLKADGVRIITSGLDMDWEGRPFDIVSFLMGLADKVDKQSAVCVVCGCNATQSYRKNKTKERIEIGTDKEYEARCFEHWMI